MGYPRAPLSWTLVLPVLFGVSIRQSIGQCGEGWTTAIGNPGIVTAGATDYVGAILQVPDGDLIVSGQFHVAGTTPLNNIARYHPSDNTWHPLGTGLTSVGLPTAQSLGLLRTPDGDIIAIGQFDTAGGVDVGGGIARYHPATDSWSPVLPEYPFAVNRAVALSNGDCVIDYLDIDSTEAPQNIARIDVSTGAASIVASGGASWCWYGPIGVLPNDEVIVGGSFDQAGDQPANCVATYSFSNDAWRPLGSGLTTGGAAVVACANAAAILPGGDLVIAGKFSEAGGLPANNIARYSPTTDHWSSLGAGTDDQITAMILLDDQTIIVGGVFRTAGGIQTGSTARFSLTTGAWSALGAGTDGIVYTAVPLDGRRFAVGGIFTQAGDHGSASIAEFAFGSSADFNHDGDTGTDADIESFFACLAGNCCPTCGTPDFNGDGDFGTDADIESFFRVLAGGPC